MGSEKWPLMPFRDRLSTRPLQNRSRALVKTLLYRTLMVPITVLVTLAVTNDASAGLQVGVVANVVKTGTYYGYERLWDRVAWAVQTAGSG